MPEYSAQVKSSWEEDQQHKAECTNLKGQDK